METSTNACLLGITDLSDAMKQGDLFTYLKKNLISDLIERLSSGLGINFICGAAEYLIDGKEWLVIIFAMRNILEIDKLKASALLQVLVMV
jgi:hypothetical protein